MAKRLISADSITPHDASAISFIVRARPKDRKMLYDQYIKGAKEISDRVKSAIKENVESEQASQNQD